MIIDLLNAHGTYSVGQASTSSGAKKTTLRAINDLLHFFNSCVRGQIKMILFWLIIIDTIHSGEVLFQIVHPPVFKSW